MNETDVVCVDQGLLYFCPLVLVGRLVDWLVLGDLIGLAIGDSLQAGLVAEALQGAYPSGRSAHLSVCVLFDEVFHWHVSATDPNEDLVALLNADIDPLVSKLIHTSRFTQEHDLHLLALRIRVNEVSQSKVDPIISLWNIVPHQHVHFVLQICDLNLQILYLHLVGLAFLANSLLL